MLFRSFTLVSVLSIVFMLGCSSYDDSDDNSQTTDGDTQETSEKSDTDNYNPMPDGDTNTTTPVADGDQATEVDGDTTPVKKEYPDGPYGNIYGEVIENFTLKDSDGNDVSLKDFYGKKKVIFINSSAGWCSVCRNETPNFEKWYQEFKDDGLVIIQTMFEDNAGSPANQDFVKSWKDQYGLTFPVLQDPTNHFINYHPAIIEGGNRFATPLNIILDKNLRISYVLEGDIPRTLHDRIKALLEND